MDEEIEKAFKLAEEVGLLPRPQLHRTLSKFYFFCDNCCKIVEPILIDGLYNVCQGCGETVLMFNPTSNHAEYHRHRSLYKRIAYFDALLSRIQAHHCLLIDDETRERIKEKMANDAGSIVNLRRALKELKLTKFYKCGYALLKLLFKPSEQQNQHNLSHQECNRLRDFFRQIQMPYEKFKTDGRRNFMSYAFVLKKLFHLIERDDLGKLLLLPKNIYSIYQHELIWASIADELGWRNDKFFF